MKLKLFKKKIEVILFNREFKNKKYAIFLGGFCKELQLNLYTVLNYSLRYVLQKNLNIVLVNNLLKFISFLDWKSLKLFLTNFIVNINLIYFLKIKNIYFFNSCLTIKNNFKNIKITGKLFILKLYKVFFNWFVFLNVIVKKKFK